MVEFTNNIFLQYGFVGLFLVVIMYYVYYSFQQDKIERKEIRFEIKKLRDDYLDYVKEITEKSLTIINKNTDELTEIKIFIKEQCKTRH